MRHADFLILAKDYKALETVANKMKEIDGVNPRILRYLGYSAYENGNIDGALKALTDYTSNPNHKIIAKDYAYLAQAKIKKAIAEDGKVFDATALTDAMTTVKKAIEMEPLIANDLNEIGKKLYEQKAFGAAAAVFEAAVSVPTSKNFLIDNFYLGNALYYDNTGKDADKRDKIALQKADVAFGNVITASPTTQDAYIFRARTNKLLENDQQMSDYYQQYIDVVSAKGEEEITKNKTKFIEAYNNMASHYANSDKAKARELLNKTLTIDPTNSYALESLKLLK
jgi:Tfp pilus assembly protein PilF